MPHLRGGQLSMRVNKVNERKIYVNPTDYTARARVCLCAGMAL